MSTPPEVVHVRLLGVPLVLRERSRQQGADLLREMTLLQAGHAAAVGTGPVGHVPGRLLELASELEVVYGPYVAAGDERMEQALDRGQDSIDVTYELPQQAAPFVDRVRQLLVEVERYCASDDYLLALAPPPDIAAYRDWSIEQVLVQAAGGPATAWPVYAARRGLAS